MCKAGPHVVGLPVAGTPAFPCVHRRLSLFSNFILVVVGPSPLKPVLRVWCGGVQRAQGDLLDEMLEFGMHAIVVKARIY